MSDNYRFFYTEISIQTTTTMLYDTNALPELATAAWTDPICWGTNRSGSRPGPASAGDSDTEMKERQRQETETTSLIYLLSTELIEIFPQLDDVARENQIGIEHDHLQNQSIDNR